MYGEQKPLGGLSPNFFGGRGPRRGRTFKFGDDRFSSDRFKICELWSTNKKL